MRLNISVLCPPTLRDGSALLSSSIATMPYLPVVGLKPERSNCRRYLTVCTCPLNPMIVAFVHSASTLGLSFCSLSMRYLISVDLPLPFFPSRA